VCDEEKAPSIYEVGGFGVGQRKYKTALKAFVSSIRDLPCHVFFCFHTKSKELTEPTGDKKKYHRWVLDISEKLDAEFIKRADNLLHIMSGYVGSMQSRTMVTQETKHVEAGCKAPCLSKVPHIVWTKDDALNYSNFRKLFT